VEYLILSGSSASFGIPKTFDEIQAVGQSAFEQAFGE